MLGGWVNQIVPSSDYVGVTGSSGSTGNSGSEHEVLESPRPARAFDADAFDGFYVREYSSLVALARVLMGPGGPAEDVAQEAMLAAYRRWSEVAVMEFPAAWVRRVCANIATSLVRKKIVEARALTMLRRRTPTLAAGNDRDSAFWGEVRRLPRRQARVSGAVLPLRVLGEGDRSDSRLLRRHGQDPPGAGTNRHGDPARHLLGRRGRSMNFETLAQREAQDALASVRGGSATGEVG